MTNYFPDILKVRNTEVSPPKLPLINVLELSSAVGNVQSIGLEHHSVRFLSLVDSAVCKGALSKGRSASRALQPNLKRVGAVCVVSDLYPCWLFCPTRLNTADDPTRSVALRAPAERSWLGFLSEDQVQKLVPGFLRRFAANWVRLVLLVSFSVQGEACRSCEFHGFSAGSWTLPEPSVPTGFPFGFLADPGAENCGCHLGLSHGSWFCSSWTDIGFLDLCLSLAVRCHDALASCLRGLPGLLQGLWICARPSCGFGLALGVLVSLSVLAGWICGLFGGFDRLWRSSGLIPACFRGFGSCRGSSPKGPKVHNRPHPQNLGLLFALAMVCCCAHQAVGMPITAGSAAERARVFQRGAINLHSTRAIKQQTRDRRDVYLRRFREWLWTEKGISFQFLLDQKPPDPERIATLLVDYGKELFYAGKSYGIYSETINSVAVSRPLVRRQLTQAWDLAFSWLADEPHCHHPAMPVSIMTAMVTVSLAWGWPHVASVIMLAWAGIMRIGEVLSASRADLVLPLDAAPDTAFLLVMIRAPKTRGRSAKHQAARVDQSDIVRYVSAMYGKASKDTKLWPFSAATLRKRFQNLLGALLLPTTKSATCRPFDLGSLRPEGPLGS